MWAKSTSSSQGHELDARTAVAQRTLESMISNTALISERQWLVAIVRKIKGEHTTLYIEGMRESEPVLFQADLFLDSATRKETVAKLPIIIGSAIDYFWTSSQLSSGTAFIRIKELDARRYEDQLSGCESMSWSITTIQAEKLLRRLIQEVRLDINYSVCGGHPSSSVSSSVSQYHNCVSWCQGILREELNLDVGSSWTPIKWPSTIMRHIIETEPQLPDQTSSSSWRRFS